MINRFIFTETIKFQKDEQYKIVMHLKIKSVLRCSSVEYNQ